MDIFFSVNVLSSVSGYIVYMNNSSDNEVIIIILNHHVSRKNTKEAIEGIKTIGLLQSP